MWKCVRKNKWSFVSVGLLTLHRREKLEIRYHAVMHVNETSEQSCNSLQKEKTPRIDWTTAVSNPKKPAKIDKKPATVRLCTTFTCSLHICVLEIAIILCLLTPFMVESDCKSNHMGVQCVLWSFKCTRSPPISRMWDMKNDQMKHVCHWINVIVSVKTA